jgi:ribulose bisphosphate carboxylase small subunit
MITPKTKKNKVDLKSLSKKEKEEIINDILDKGYNNLNEYDIKILKKVSKSI